MKTNKAVIQFRIGALGSLLATSIALISQLTSVEVLDNFLHIATVLLAFSIPTIGMDLYLMFSELLTEKTFKSIFRELMRFLATVAFFAAIVLVFFHFSQLAGFVFIAILLLCVVTFVRLYSTRLK